MTREVETPRQSAVWAVVGGAATAVAVAVLAPAHAWPWVAPLAAVAMAPVAFASRRYTARLLARADESPQLPPGTRGAAPTSLWRSPPSAYGMATSVAVAFAAGAAIAFGTGDRSLGMSLLIGLVAALVAAAVLAVWWRRRRAPTGGPRG